MIHATHATAHVAVTRSTAHTAAHDIARTDTRAAAPIIHADASRATDTLGTRLWHLRLARSPLHANTLARAHGLARQPRVQPRLSAELISRSILKKPVSSEATGSTNLKT